jgi:hypothetical protein
VLTLCRRVAGVGGYYQATAINNHGAIAGLVTQGRIFPPQPEFGLFWRKPNQIPYKISAPSNGRVFPTSVGNNEVRPTVVGSFRFGDGSTHAFRWTTSGPFEDITPPGFESAEALDVNDAGYVVGWGVDQHDRYQALRWAPGAGNQAVILGEGVATTVAYGGDALGMAGTTTRVWRLNGSTAQLPGPQISRIDDLSGNGRLVGYTYRYDRISGKQPWTVFNGRTTWLPVPNNLLSLGVANLRVNACGSIVATQWNRSVIKGDYQPPRGLLYSKFSCDVAGRLP